MKKLKLNLKQKNLRRAANLVRATMEKRSLKQKNLTESVQGQSYVMKNLQRKLPLGQGQGQVPDPEGKATLHLKDHIKDLRQDMTSVIQNHQVEGMVEEIEDDEKADLRSLLKRKNSNC